MFFAQVMGGLTEEKVTSLGSIVMKNFMAYLRDESGQTSTEYILLVAVVAAVVFKFRTVIMTKLVEGDDSLVNKVFDRADKLLDDGN